MRFIRKEKEDFKRSNFRIALLAIIVALITIRLIDVYVFPDTKVIPIDFFIALAVVQLFFLWFDEVKERYRITWVQKKKDELNDMKMKFTFQKRKAKLMRSLNSGLVNIGSLS